MIETYFLVPTKSNEGKPFARSMFRELESKLADRFGGWTKAGQVQGGWRDDRGKMIHDRSEKYIVAVEKVTDLVDLIVRWVRRQWEQDCIYFSALGTVELIR